MFNMKINGSYRNESEQYLSILEVDYEKWKIFLFFEIVYLIVGIYMLIGFIFFTIKTLTRERSKSSLPKMLDLKRTRNILLSFVIVYALFSVLKFALAPYLYWGPPKSIEARKYCKLTGQLFQSFHVLGSTSAFLFLWLRQHSFQQGARYLSASTKHVMRFSWFLFGVTLVTGGAAMVGTISTISISGFLYIPDSNACSLTTNSDINSVIVHIGYTIVVSMQVSILLLFVYVLKRSQKERKEYLRKGEFPSDTSSKIHSLIRNSTIAAAISSVSNLVVIVSYLMFKGTISQLVVNFAWDTDNMISLGCIVFCFSYWKKLLIPWSRFCNSKKFELPEAYFQNQEETKFT